MLRRLTHFCLAVASIALGWSAITPAFAVWPLPSYGSYPACGSGVTPAENCSSQGGDPEIHQQVKFSERSVQFPATYSCTPQSGPFGGFCDGPSCTSQAGFCRQPAILGTPTAEVETKKDGAYVRFHVEYDFPGNYCQLSPDGKVAEWPIVFNNYHLNRLQVIASNGEVLAESMAVFEHGQWNPLLRVCGFPATFKLRVLNECAGLDQTFDLTVDDTTVSPVPCGGSRLCPWCSSGGPGLPGLPGEPINVGSGDVTVNVPLFSIGQSPMPLSFGLTYHSELAGNVRRINEPLGRGWTHGFNESLRIIDPIDNDLYRLRGNGDESWYVPPPDTAGIWTAAAPGELRETVTQVGALRQVKDLDGRITSFDATSGAWLSTVDRWSNSIAGTYTNGLLTAITDSEGRQVQLAYTAGLLTQVTLPDGQTWRFAYAGGELAQIYDPLHPGTTPWRTFEYAADSRGKARLVSAVRDEAGKLLEGHAYDALDRGISSFSEAGRGAVSVSFDGPIPANATVTTSVDGATTQTATFNQIYQRGRYLPLQVNGTCASCGGGSDTETFTFDQSNHPLSRVDGDGHLTTYSYDANGMVLSRIEADGTTRQRTTTYSYAYGPWPTFATQITETSAVRGGAFKTTTNAWNTTGPSETTLTASVSGYLHTTDATPTTFTTTQTFDGRHRLLTTAGPRTDVNQITTRVYYPDADATLNRRGRLQRVTDAVGLTSTLDNYDLYGTPLLSIDPNGVQTVAQTDSRGRSVSRTLKAVAGDPREPADYTSTVAYDGRDRLIRTISARGTAMGYRYEDGTNRLTDTIRLDASGNEVERRHVTFNLIGDKIREEDQQCASPAAVCTSWTTRRQEDFSYDVHNRLAAVNHAIPSGSSIRNTYDGAGLLATVADENHAAPNTAYSYDELNRLAAVTQTLGSGSVTTRYAYDVQDNLVSVTDPNGNTTTYAYDDFRRMQAQTSPVTGTTTYSYDPAGNLTSTTDANGATTARTYDADNRGLTATSTRGGATTETLAWTYDDATAGNYGKGRLARSSDPTGSMTYAYERRGLLRQEQHAVQGNAYSILYGYDPNGNRSSITYPSGRVVGYTFDYADRLLSAASGATSFVTSAGYLPFGPEAQLVYGNGTTKTTSYDLRYRPAGNRLTSGAAVLADYQYTEDAVGNITAIHDLVDAGFNRDFGYDDLQRLTTASSGSALWGAGTYSYDAMGNMLSLNLGNSRASSFAYSGLLPKLTSVTENGSTRTVQYDAAGNEQTVGAGAFAYTARNSLAAADGLSYLYDARGIRRITNVTAALGTLSGTIVAASNQAAVAGATVTVDGTLNSTTSDAAGNFTLNVGAGSYSVTAVKSGFLPGTSTAFSVAAGATVPVGTLALSVAPSTVSGTVVSSLGGTVAGATVALNGTNNSAVTNAAGVFSLTQAAGTFTATLSAPGYQPQTTASFTTAPGQAYSLGNLTLTAIPATISGTITTSAGTPVAGATVTAGGGADSLTAVTQSRRAGVNSTFSATTDAAGNFQLSVGAGTYTLTIAKTGYATTTTGAISVGPGVTYSTGTLTVDPLGAVTGAIVTQLGGTPVAGASISIVGSLATTTTDAAGHFTASVPAGSYAVKVSASGYADLSTAFFAVTPGATHDTGTLQLAPVALSVSVGYADDLRPSSAFPVPWNGAPNTLYLGTASPVDAGAIRLDNSTAQPMAIDSVAVDLGRPGPAYNLWSNFTIPANGSVILTQTAQFNFDTSDSPIVACGTAPVPGDPRVPRVVVTVGGASTTYFDTGHILDTGGYDLACNGNESLQWRRIGTTGIASNGDFLLAPPTGKGTLGQPYTITATATDPNGQPLAGASLTFTVLSGPNSGRTGQATTGANGSATFTYTSTIAGNDTVQATIANASGGSLRSNVVAVTWPAFSNINVFVSYADDLRAGASFPNPWQGSPNLRFIGDRGPGWDTGAIRIDNPGDQPIHVDSVDVDMQYGGIHYNLWPAFDVAPHQSTILAQTSGNNFDSSDPGYLGCGQPINAGNEHIPKITITIGGLSASYLDTGHILDTFGYDLACRANESLQWRPVGSSSTADAGHLAILPPSSTNVVGSTASVLAVATDAGNEPVANLPIDFRITTGPNAGRSGQAVTNASGIATFTYTSAIHGTDTLTASNTNTVGSVLQAPTSSAVNWIDTATLTLGPASQTLSIGAAANVSAHVSDGSGGALPNVYVTFRVTAGPDAGKSGQALSDAGGNAPFTYLGLTAGSDSIVASIAGAAGNTILSNQTGVVWTQPMTLTLAPLTETNAIGASYSATATLLAGSQPLSGANVTFQIVGGPNAGKSFQATTDAAGHAALGYSSTVTGTDVVQASASGLTSNQVLAAWVSVPTTLRYTGPAAGEVSDAVTLSARLTEAQSGSAVAGQQVQFTFAGQSLPATTDGDGTARLAVTPAQTGAAPIGLRFNGAGAWAGSSASAFLSVVRDETSIAYTGKPVVAFGLPQTVSARLTDPDGQAPVAGKTITFVVGSVTATATTDATGTATTTMTIPASAGTGPTRLLIAFAGDAAWLPATTSAPVLLYQPQSFVIWGGNAVRPKRGDRVNFWGSQWDRQVTGGDYAANASFKGYASSAASPLVSCQPAAHADGKCWSSKPGNSFPPATLERYISVIVATSIVKNGGSIDGNIASTVVVRVDPNPAYGNDPGKPGYGTIVGVIDDGARLFASAAMVPAADATYFFRHLAVPRHTPVAHLASAMPGDDELRALTSSAWSELALSVETLARTSVLTPAPLSVSAGSRRYSFYTPEMNLLAETTLAATGTPPIAYEYVWFNGHPVAQFDVATSTTHWTFTDHLGTPILQTDAAAQTWWRAEYEPFGAVYALRSADQHQPLRLPGQEAEQLNLGANGVTERQYNIFRWYRSASGRYTQSDPMGIDGGVNLYAYAEDNSLLYQDSLGLKATPLPRPPVPKQLPEMCPKAKPGAPGPPWLAPFLMAVTIFFDADPLSPNEYRRPEYCGSCDDPNDKVERCKKACVKTYEIRYDECSERFSGNKNKQRLCYERIAEMLEDCLKGCDGKN